MNKLLVLISLIVLPLTLLAGRKDSLRMEKIDGKKYIVHRVDPKETLYSISKRYGSSIDEIYNSNDSLEYGLKMYDEILIPYSKSKKRRKASPSTTAPSDIHIVKAGETLYSISKQYDLPLDSLKAMNQLTTNQIGLGDTLMLRREKPQEIVPTSGPPIDSGRYHIVQPSETLFGIARQYEVSLDELMEWNEMQDYNLSIGQKLLVGKSDTTTVESDAPGILVDLPDLEEDESPLDTTYVKTDNSLFKTKTIEEDGEEWIVEQGFAMRIEDTDFTTKLLALHKTAPMGSLVRVTNRMTNKEVEVRVVGELPETGLNRNVLLRLSTAAYKELGALDQKIPVTSSYPKEN